MPPEHLTIERTPWWKGDRGEWLVVEQIALIGLVFLGPVRAELVDGWICGCSLRVP